MPVYQYACNDCENEFEKRQGFNDDPIDICPSCEGSVRRVISPVGIIFKGTGFYINDSKKSKNGSNGQTKSTVTSTTEGTTDTSSDTKPKAETTSTSSDTSTTSTTASTK